MWLFVLCVHLHSCNTTGQGDLMFMQMGNEQEVTQNGSGSTQPLCTELLTHHPIFIPGPQSMASSHTLKMLISFGCRFVALGFFCLTISPGDRQGGKRELPEQKGISRSAQGFQLPQNAFQPLQATNALSYFLQGLTQGCWSGSYSTRKAKDSRQGPDTQQQQQHQNLQLSWTPTWCKRGLHPWKTSFHFTKR